MSAPPSAYVPISCHCLVCVDGFQKYIRHIETALISEVLDAFYQALSLVAVASHLFVFCYVSFLLILFCLNCN